MITALIPAAPLPSVAAPAAILIIALLVALLVAKQVVRVVRSPGAGAAGRVLDAAIAPLLVTFVLVSAWNVLRTLG